MVRSCHTSPPSRQGPSAPRRCFLVCRSTLMRRRVLSPYLFRSGVEHKTMFFWRLVEAEIHQADNSLAHEAVALEGTENRPAGRTWKSFLMAHSDMREISFPPVSNTSVSKSWTLMGGQVLQNLIVAPGLDVGLAVPRLKCASMCSGFAQSQEDPRPMCSRGSAIMETMPGGHCRYEG